MAYASHKYWRTTMSIGTEKKQIENGNFVDVSQAYHSSPKMVAPQTAS